MKRICPKCHAEKELTEFYSGWTNTRRCKKCWSEDARMRRAKNPEKYRNAVREWNERNPEKRKQVTADQNRKRRQKFLDMYWRECKCCWEKIEQFLTLEHILRDWHEERKKYWTGYMYQIAIKEYRPDRYEVLCYNCNNAKWRYWKCPHMCMIQWDRQICNKNLWTTIPTP